MTREELKKGNDIIGQIRFLMQEENELSHVMGDIIKTGYIELSPNPSRTPWIVKDPDKKEVIKKLLQDDIDSIRMRIKDLEDKFEQL